MLPIQLSLRTIAHEEKATTSSHFFKTGKGEYGEGDVFLGVSVPDTRKAVLNYLQEMSLEKVEILLQSKYHEDRLAGCLTLREFIKKKHYSLTEIAEFYIQHRECINNWDLVDSSSEYIIGPYLSECLMPEERELFIDSCIQCPHLWTNRIIVLASFYMIKKGDAQLAFSIIVRFMSHPHDLMHKACGWMLREVGKRVNETILCEFLDTHKQNMPRTMLRYAIERLDPEKKTFYMQR